MCIYIMSTYSLSIKTLEQKQPLQYPREQGRIPPSFMEEYRRWSTDKPLQFPFSHRLNSDVAGPFQRRDGRHEVRYTREP